MEKIIQFLESQNIQVSEYKENGVLCGYELNTYTNDGVNMIVFLDFRDENMDPLNRIDFIKEFEQYINDFDIDEKIMLTRQDKSYVEKFSLSKSLKDFKSWKKEMKTIIKTLKNI